MKLITLGVALLALAFPLGLILLHPSSGASLDWDGGGRPVVHARPQHLAAR